MEKKFRGKSLRSGEWVYGSLVIYGFSHVTPDIYDPETSQFMAVDAKTIGQYIGEKDKSGAELYEGQKVEALFVSIDDRELIKGKVTWDEMNLTWVVGSPDTLMMYNIGGVAEIKVVEETTK